MSLPRNLKLTDLIRKEPVDFKAPGEPDEVKYRRHRRRALDMEEGISFSFKGNTRKINPLNFTKEDLQFLKQMDKADLDEALNLIQRMRKARILKRIKAKIQRGAKLARRRVANLATLTRRARRAARNLILMKITKGVPKGDLPFARRQELEKRLSMPSIARRIGTIAKRLVPTMRKKEVERKRSANLKRAGAK